MPPASDEPWNYHYMALLTEFAILMPNGTLHRLSLERELSLKAAKATIWNQVKMEPLSKILKSPNSYVFVGVNADGQMEEFHDESRRLCDLRLFNPTLRLVIPKATPSEAITQSLVSQAIGMAIQEFDSPKELEIDECRKAFLILAQKQVEERRSYSDEKRLLYYYSPDVETSSQEASISENDVCCLVYTRSHTLSTQENGAKQVETDLLPPKPAIKITLKASLTVSQAIEQMSKIQPLPEKTVLKVCGFEEYLVGDFKLYQYKFISHSICHKKNVELFVCNQSSLLNDLRDSIDNFIKPQSLFDRMKNELDGPNWNKKPTREDLIHGNIKSLWYVTEPFNVKINMATYVHVKELNNLVVCVGLYHGTELLCPILQTQEVIARAPAWHQKLEFGISVEDLPRSTILCLSLCDSDSRGNRSITPFAYGNIPIFDYTGRLRSGKFIMSLWRIPGDRTGCILYPLGIIGLTDERDAHTVEIEFEKYHQRPVYFPPDETINESAQKLWDIDSKSARGEKNSQLLEPNDSQKEHLARLARRDPLAVLTESDKNLLWAARSYCREYLPDSLPKLLESVRWNCREDVARMYYLLDQWPLVSVGTALVLLDCKFTDLKVRSFAIRCLEKGLPLHTLKEYLLQLVQVVLHELYLNTDTSRFLLTSALKDRAFGHQFFWLLRAESHQLSHTKICSLLLEAYCRGIGSVQLHSLLKQKEAIEKLNALSEALSDPSRASLSAEKRVSYLRQTLKEVDTSASLQELPNPVRPKISLGKLVPSECRIMDSAKRPLFIVWENGDLTKRLTSEATLLNHELIFKNGDDLRQDMLTLQVIRIMDTIWRSESLDFKMIPYSCLVTGCQTGLIEVVKGAKTVMSIQRSLGPRVAFQFQSRELHKWFERERSKENYDRMMDNFTRTCAGYSMVTFVLGIGDRNPDNIMINEEGQIFHIDFGHFLGHFKKKFGINRERVPFVLPDDFLYVISRGREFDESPEIKE